MKTLFFCTIILCLSFTFDEGQKELLQDVTLEKSVKDDSLSVSEAVYKFTFENIYDNITNRSIRFSIDGKEETRELTDNNFIEVKTVPGNHKFLFYYNSDYSEIFTDSLFIEPQFRNDYRVYMWRTDEIIEVEKPVIYLYPETEIDVEVELDVKGKLTFTYPEYKNGWKFKADPNGTLTFGESTYNYLFWESSQRYVITSNNAANGFKVKGVDAVSFLEEKLTEAGLNSKEQTDFITYWGPRLSQNETNFVRFEFNETCDLYAELNINPKPDNIYRIYMLWYPTSSEHKVNEQIITPIKREGFTVVEWGGRDLSQQFKSSKSSRL